MMPMKPFCCGLLLWAAASAPLCAPLCAEDMMKELNDKGKNKFKFSIGLARADADVKITDVETSLPDLTRLDSVIDDLDIAVDDGLRLSSTAVLASFSYFPLPFLEITANAGLVSAKSDIAVTLSGQPNLGPNLGLGLGLGLGLLDDPFSINVANTGSLDGYTLGGGVALYAPISKIDNFPLLFRLGGQANFNTFDGRDISSEIYSATASFIYPRKLFGRQVFGLIGTTYRQIERFTTLETSLGNSVGSIRIEQQLEEPWNANLGFGAKLSDTVSLNISNTIAFNGNLSNLIRLTIDF